MINPVKMDFDPVKNSVNQEKHGVSLAIAERLDWVLAVASPDQRSDYGEERMIGYAPLEDRLYCVVFVDRGDVRRIISLRKANSREVKAYVQSQSFFADSDA
ncbi:MAG: BrnT family toxin [Magnetococcales bacterium]|nr:BrnT family toxin [Magnetococcales bacterium]